MRAPLLVIDGNSLRTAPITPCPRASAAAATEAQGPFLASPTTSCASTRARSRGPYWSPGTRSMLRPTGMMPCPRISRAGSSMTSLSTSSKCYPEFVTACGFACAKAAGYEADDFLAAAVAREERRGGMTIVATGITTPTSLLPSAPPSCSRFGPAKAERCGHGMVSTRSRCPTSSPCAATAQTAYRASPAWGHRAPQACCAGTARSKMPSRPDASRPRLKCCASIARSRPSIRAAAALARSEAQLGKGRGTRARPAA